MPTIYVTDGDRDAIIDWVGLTVLDYTDPDGNYAAFGDISRGYKRCVDVDLPSLDGILSGAGMIGYFSEAALAKPRPGADVPLLVELIASSPQREGVLPPLLRNSPESISGRAPPHLLSLEEQQALFARVLGKDWSQQVERFLKRRAEAVAAPSPAEGQPAGPGRGAAKG